MNSLDELIPTPRLLEEDHVDVRASAAEAWQLLRYSDLQRSMLIRALFWLRSLPVRLAGRDPGSSSIRVDDLVSSAERPGFQVDRSAERVHGGAIGKVWQAEIPFVHVTDAARYCSFAEPVTSNNTFA